ncbi:alpha/beta fold hydrolase [Corynebacterium qintianiae]|uniref:alpha/beta fold hydrolase n=1 Tax=Corynebacterium qintianiae TaxID=2709392 RepID=UPI0013ED408F|nr:alpha/beta fold hydrolase [Corynebacterium qintianiae]
MNWTVLAAVLTTCLTVSLAASPLAGAQPSPAVTREECPSTVNVAGAECGRFDTPMRYDDPSGPTISVGYVRIPAADPSSRRGALFGNPGGPGGDAYTYFGTEGIGFSWPEEIRNEWDLVAVQPRGLMHSTPLNCQSPDPQTPVDLARLQFDSTFSGGGLTRSLCQGGRPGYPESITTENNARDWDAARRALGYDKISIMGLSYGTYLGSAYASMFPERTDRVVLDSAMDPNLSWQALMRTQQGGYERALNDYFAFVAANDAKYGMGDTPLKAYQYWSNRIVAEAGTNPTVTPPPARVGDLPPGLESAGQAAADAITATGKARVEGDGIISRLFNPGASQVNSPLLLTTRMTLPQPQGWDTLARMTNGSLEPSGASGAPQAVLEELQGQQIALNQLQAVQMCNENITPPDYGLVPAALWSSYVTGDLFTMPNAVIGSGMYCSGAGAVTGLAPLDGSRLAHRPLQINATGDPQTVYSGHRALADAMGSQVVTVHGPGHGHVGLGNKAVDRIVVDYLRNGFTGATDAPGFFEQ